MRLRVCLALLLLLVGGAGFAAGGPGNPSAHGAGTRYGRSPLPGAVARGLRPSAAELRMAAGAGGGIIKRVALIGGRAVPYVGTALLLWEAVNLAVNWNKGLSSPATSGHFETDCAFEVIQSGCSRPLPEPGPFPASGQTVWWTGPLSNQDGVTVQFQVTGYTITGGSLRFGFRGEILNTANSECRTNWANGNGGAYRDSAYVLGAFDVFLNKMRQCFNIGAQRSVRELIAEETRAAELARRIINGQQDEIIADPNRYPQTFGSPLPGVQLTPAPNRNQWENNPYADPRIDTDNDGWPDWKEDQAGTNPSDPNSRPTVDPSPGKAPPITDPENPFYDPVKDPTHPDYDPELDPDYDPTKDPTHPDYDPDADPEPDALPDADGDGIPDEYDPCPFDRFNRCAEVDEEEPLEFPDDYAREYTQQEIADILRQIRDQEQPEEEDPEEEDPGEFVAPDLELDEWTPGQLTADAWDGVEARLSGRWEAFAVAAGAKMAFSLGSWIPIVTLGGSSAPCEPINLTLLGVTNDIGFCASPIHGFLSTGGRLALLALVLIGFYLATARTLSWA